MGVLAPDGAAVSLHQDGAQPAAVVDVFIRLEHPVVALAQPGFVAVEAVQVLHAELADTEQPAAGARLVAELGLNLVQEQGQVAVALDVVAGELGDYLLMGGAQGKLALFTIEEDEQALAEGDIAPGLVPQLYGLQHRQHQLLSAGAVHLLPDDVLNLLQHPPAQGQVGVYPGSHLVYHSRFQQQLVADSLRLSRHLSLRLAEELRYAQFSINLSSRV